MAVQVKAGLWSYQDEPLKLSQVRLDGTVQNVTANLNLMLTYILDAKQQPIDALFKFPLYDLGTVTAFEAFVNLRTLVKSKAIEKSKVDEELKAANLSWFQDDLLELNATDLFVCRLGRLQVPLSSLIFPALDSTLILFHTIFELCYLNSGRGSRLRDSVVPVHKSPVFVLVFSPHAPYSLCSLDQMCVLRSVSPQR